MKKTLLILCVMMVISSGAYAAIWDAVSSFSPVNAPQNPGDVWTYRMGDYPVSEGGPGAAPGTLLSYANPVGDGSTGGAGYGNPVGGNTGWVGLPASSATFTTWTADVTWLSPITGSVDVSGLLQCEYASSGRDRNWALLHNGATVQTWVNPDALTPYFVNLSVAAGDTLAMRTIKTPSSTGPYYDHLSMTVTEVIPEPATLALLACGGLLLRRKRRG